FPDFLDLGFRALETARRRGELRFDLPDCFLIFLGKRASQHVGAPGWEPGKGFADLQDVLLVDHLSMRAAKTLFQRGVRIGLWFQLLIAQSKMALFVFIGSTGTNHADDGDETIDIVDGAHATE